MERVLIPSLTQNLNEGLFMFFSSSLNWIKEKSMATLAIRNICDQTQNKQVSSPTVLHFDWNLVPFRRGILHHEIILSTWLPQGIPEFWYGFACVFDIQIFSYTFTQTLY